MSYQDWEPVVFNKTIKKSTNTFNPAGTKEFIELNQDDIPKINYVSKEQSQVIIEARNLKKLTQKELAQLCNLDISIIKNYETQKCPFNKQIYNKILRVLNIKLI